MRVTYTFTCICMKYTTFRTCIIQSEGKIQANPTEGTTPQ